MPGHPLPSSLGYGNGAVDWSIKVGMNVDGEGRTRPTLLALTTEGENLGSSDFRT